jgi:hypothetical protein
VFFTNASVVAETPLGQAYSRASVNILSKYNIEIQWKLIEHTGGGRIQIHLTVPTIGSREYPIIQSGPKDGQTQGNQYDAPDIFDNTHERTFKIKKRRSSVYMNSPITLPYGSLDQCTHRPERQNTCDVQACETRSQSSTQQSLITNFNVCAITEPIMNQWTDDYHHMLIRDDQVDEPDASIPTRITSYDKFCCQVNESDDHDNDQANDQLAVSYYHIILQHVNSEIQNPNYMNVEKNNETGWNRQSIPIAITDDMQNMGSNMTGTMNQLTMIREFHSSNDYMNEIIATGRHNLDLSYKEKLKDSDGSINIAGSDDNIEWHQLKLTYSADAYVINVLIKISYDVIEPKQIEIYN